MSQQGGVYFRQGDGALVVPTGTKIVFDGGALVPSTETQADAISDLSLSGTYSTDDTPIETAINEILAALRGVGIVASS